MITVCVCPVNLHSNSGPNDLTLRSLSRYIIPGDDKKKYTSGILSFSGFAATHSCICPLWYLCAKKKSAERVCI